MLHAVSHSFLCFFSLKSIMLIQGFYPNSVIFCRQILLLTKHYLLVKLEVMDRHVVGVPFVYRLCRRRFLYDASPLQLFFYLAHAAVAFYTALPYNFHSKRNQYLLVHRPHYLCNK